MAVNFKKDHSHWWIAAIVFVILIIVTIILLAMAGYFGKGLTEAQRLGPNAPANQKVVIAQRNDNSKYQVVLSTYSGAGTSASTMTWDQMYYIMFNPATGSDPTLTVFDTYDAAYNYYNTEYVASPMNKSYSPISTTALNADYTNIKKLT